MNLSAVFIDRPIATTLLSLGCVLAGILAFFQLPVASLPQVDFPTISVQASLPGASPEVMAATVATPLERAFGHIAGIAEMTSTSSYGSSNINLQFELERDIDGAARDVQAAINAASSLLPTNMPSRPRYRKTNPGDMPVMLLALTSETQSRSELYDIASTILAQKLSQIEGIGQVNVAGSSLPAVRIELNPFTLAKYGIGFEDVRTAITATNVNRPKGVLEDDARHWQIYVNDQAKKAVDYLPLIIAYRNGAAVRLSDIGTAIDSSEDLRNAGYLNNKPAVILVLFKQSGANIIETVDRIKVLMPQLQATIPGSIKLTEVLDRSATIRSSLHEVEHSLIISVVLVILVVFVFLRNVRSAIIPIVTVPMSLLGTFGVMYLFHYTLDNLSLMALTVATGFVVDDAIVVLENTSRYIEQGLPPREAALKGAREVSFTVLTMSLSLIAVFIPILLMGGVVGRLFQEFAVTLSAAVMVSLLVSLTTAPMLCAFLMRGEGKQRTEDRGQKAEDRWRVTSFLSSGFSHLSSGYARSLQWALDRAPLMMLILLCTIALNVCLYIIVDKGFFPMQDVGRLTGTIQADQGISSQALQEKLASFVKIVSQDPEVVRVVGFTGASGGGRLSNSGQLFAILKPLEQRKLNVNELMDRLRRKLSNIPGAKLFLKPVQELNIGARGSAALFEYSLQADQLSELRSWTLKILKALQQRPELEDVNTNQQDKGEQISLKIDRSAAARLGVSQTLIDSTLNDAFGQRQVSNIYNPLNQYHVVMEVDPQYAQNAETLKSVYVSIPPSTQYPDGIQVPLSAFASYEQTNTPLSVNHQGQFPTSTISFNLKSGSSLSTATQVITETMHKIGVPADVHGSFQGSAKAFAQSLKTQPLLVLAALITIYIVLGILYESYIHPLTIISTLPSAGVGAILALICFKTEFSIIALIGVILLIGIVKKNAIMMIDFALNAERTLGMAPKDAIRTACLMRFRPIMMTTFAALLAALPLAFGTGYGSELRRPLGMTIVGGLMVSQVLTLYTTPVVYLYLDRFQFFCRRWFSRKTV